MLNLNLQRGLGASACNGGGDLPQHRAIPGGENHGCGGALEDTGAKESQVGGAGGGGLFAGWHGGSYLRHGLPRQRGVVHLRLVSTEDNPNIGRDLHTCLQKNHVPWNQLVGVQIFLVAGAVIGLPDDPHLLLALHGCERVEQCLRLHLCVPLQQRGTHDDEAEQTGGHEIGLLLGLPLLNLLLVKHDEGHLSRHAGPEQKVEHPRESELEQLDPGVLPLWRGDSVVSVQLLGAGRLTCLQSAWPGIALAVGRQLRLQSVG
mmetsp:Transcript_108133/g.247982  ORF Transcript_108133/g.247982 Transcript_108133/m.247982 type:complete len:261 (-) Transcript_108133:196-978(-)